MSKKFKLKKAQLDWLEEQVGEAIADMMVEFAFELSHDDMVRIDAEARRQLAARLVC